METRTAGIHHLTAISGEPQATVDFYAGILGLRLVKKTINYDDPGTYHLYFGNRAGSPGGILTFFPWGSLGGKGRRGPGQVSSLAFSLPAGSLDFWRRRLASFGVETRLSGDGEAEASLAFRDPDGLGLELVDAGESPRAGVWSEAVPEESAILGFRSVLLAVRKPELTARLMTRALGFRSLGETRDGLRLGAAEGGPASLVELRADRREESGRMGAGVFHHIAWRAADDAAQAALRAQVAAEGADATPVIDRTYFRSVYFREPNGILFEIATDAPGFAVDEGPEQLGLKLALPPWLETERAELEASLTPLHTPRLVPSEEVSETGP